MHKEEIDLLWQDKNNWKRIGFYSCQRDPRIIVPKRIKWMGWTINFAHPLAIPTIFIIILLSVGPTLFVLFFTYPTVDSIIWTLGASIIAVVSLCYYLSSRNDKIFNNTWKLLRRNR